MEYKTNIVRSNKKRGIIRTIIKLIEMKQKTISINTINQSKQEEIKFIFKDLDFDLQFLNYEVREILSQDVEEVVKNKAISAYGRWRLPIVVEHGSLKIKYLNGFPGALSKPMWDLMNGKICKTIPNGDTRGAEVISCVGFCDGKILKTFTGVTKGVISLDSRGTYGFQFDPIFIPKGSEKTYAEMQLEDKMKYSQATKSYNKLIKFLSEYDQNIS